MPKKPCSGSILLRTTIALPAVRRFEVAQVLNQRQVLGGFAISGINATFYEHFGSVVEENVPKKYLPCYEVTRKGTLNPLEQITGVATHLVRMAQIMQMGEYGLGCFQEGHFNYHYVVSPKDGRLKLISWGLLNNRLTIGAPEEPGERSFLFDERIFGN
jgi:hypothetical protein